MGSQNDNKDLTDIRSAADPKAKAKKNYYSFLIYMFNSKSQL